MSGSDHVYRFGTKNNWRRWAWNRISENICDKRNAVCVYLPGSEDLDRPIAISKGFSSENLIGVERNANAVMRAREVGALCVNGEFGPAVKAIQKNREVRAVFADYTKGIYTDNLVEAIDWMFLRNLSKATFAINLLRGRDSGFSRCVVALESRYRTVFESATLSHIEPRKHRGFLLHLCIFETLTKHIDFSMYECPSDAYGAFYGMSNPALFSYKSGVQVFDSIVFNNPAPQIFDFDSEVGDEILDDVSELIASDLKSPKAAKVARSVSAVMAHRTMRSAS